ncbi:MAG: isoprenylcysteine carboxylmethyltransferase family protein [Candidatus Aerophobetes bacterium]|nr:isoprenylcysteine carboxylmethyltransferase family protein [Candidatus Aerophobetes bacterium]
MLAISLCIGICAIIWIVNGIWIRQAAKERFTAEIYIHAGLGIFFTLLALELTIGIRGAWMHFEIGWLALIGWILYIPSAILVFGSLIQLKRKGKPATYDPSYTTAFVDTGIYGVIRQPISLGMAIWSIALILVFQSMLSIVLGISAIFFCWMSARKEAEYNIGKFGDKYKEYMRRVPMWNLWKGLTKGR